MNWDQLEGKCWGKLTDDDLDAIRGRREILVGRLQERYGMAREQADREADEWSRQLFDKDYPTRWVTQPAVQR
jgi:uncharacterized protein YjbJ (UPF0337 family)